LKISKGYSDCWKKPQNKKGLLRWSRKPKIPILTLQKLKRIEQNMMNLKCQNTRIRVKIGICGLHDHPSDPFLFRGFFAVIPILLFSIFIMHNSYKRPWFFWHLGSIINNPWTRKFCWIAVRRMSGTHKFACCNLMFSHIKWNQWQPSSNIYMGCYFCKCHDLEKITNLFFYHYLTLNCRCAVYEGNYCITECMAYPNLAIRIATLSYSWIYADQ